MKRLWMIVSTLAIANMLAVVGLLAWLHTSDRLSRERIESIRTILAVTQAQEDQAKAEAETAAAEAAKRAADEARQAVPPVTAAERIAEAQLEAEKELQSVLRQRQELESLRAGLARQLNDLEQREKRLADQRAAFEAERVRFAELEGSQQFKVALSALESQKPKDAKAVLKSMLDGRQTEQVIAYLSKMDDAKRSKVIAEFVKDEPAVAADLLERLRTRGMPAGPSPAGGAPLANAGSRATTAHDASTPDTPRSGAARPGQ